MDAKKAKLDIPEDKNLEQAYQKYQLLKQAVDAWQQERRSYWQKMITLAEKPPYLPLTDLPAEAIIELWQRLNHAANVEIPDAALMEMWGQYRENQNAMDEETATRFQLAVSGVARLAGEMAQNLEWSANEPHDSIVCPVCDEEAALAVITPPDGKRMMHCTTCGYEWNVKRVKCLHCGSEDAKQQTFLKNEEFPGIEVVVCQSCGQYFKEIDARERPVQDYLWEDVRTLPLNFAAEFWLAEQAKKNDQVH